MKKYSTQFVVVAMTAVFALSACERRQRPPKPLATETKDKDDKEKKQTTDNPANGGTTDNKSKTNNQTGAEDDKNNGNTGAELEAGSETAEGALPQKEYVAAMNDLGNKVIAINNRKLGVQVGLSSEKKYDIQMKSEVALKAIQEEARKRVAAAPETTAVDNENQVAGELHRDLVAAHNAAMLVLTNYAKGDFEAKIEPKAVQNMQDEPGIKQMTVDLENARSLHKAIDELDRYLRTEKLIGNKVPELHK